MDDDDPDLAFRHGLCADCIRVLDESVRRNNSNAELEKKAMEAGERLAQGSVDLDDVCAIVRWKAPRSVHWLPARSDDHVISALSRATATESNDEDRLDALLEIRGVGIPVASAVLTCLDPNRFTVIDVRALDSLGRKPPAANQYRKLYLQYLAFCRREAARLGIRLRVLDRALWKAGTIN